METKPTPAWVTPVSLGLLVVGGLVVYELSQARMRRQLEAESRPLAAPPAGIALPAAPAPAVEPMRLTNVALWRAYASNEIAADDRYLGKPLLVEAIVDSVEKNAFDEIVLKLASPNPYMPTMAGIETSQRSVVAGLRPHQEVRLLCTGGGKVLGAPVLHACIVQAVRN